MYGHLFKPELIINGKTGASNNFAKGFFTEGRDKDRSSSENLNEIYIFRCRDVIRRHGSDP